MREISALTILKILDNPNKPIGVFCKEPRKVIEEVEPYLWISSKVLKGSCRIELNTRGRVQFFDSSYTADERLCGFRFDLLLLEGGEEDYSERFKQEVLMPFLAVVKDPTTLQKLCDEMGHGIPHHWINESRLIFTNESNCSKTT